MTGLEQRHFEMLRQGPCVPAEYVTAFYGLPFPLPDDFRTKYETWASQRRRRPGCDKECISRYELESFMRKLKVVPKKWMGARLGMSLHSIELLLSHLEEIGMQPQRYVVYSDLISEALPEDIIPNLPSLKFRISSDHNSFCTRLHIDLDQVLGFKVEPLFCATSDRIQDYPRQFASDFDCLTLAPVSGKHQIWLDFRKPLNLPPDRCSKLFYVENREALRPYCASTEEPADLDVYAQLLAAHDHG